jgi:SAM-dependent methyltransferase
MAAVARRAGIAAEVAKFEDWDAAGRTFDAVVAGQTWHWVDPLAGAAKAAAVLRPGGRVALFWNVMQTPPDLSEAFAALYGRVVPQLAVDPATPALALYEVMFTTAEDGLRRTGGFAAPERWREDWERRYTRDGWLDQVPTFGGFPRLAPEQQEEILAGVAAAIDAVGGAFTMSYATVAVTAVRT